MSETMEQIAERIARDHIGTASYYDAARSLLKDDVLSALRNERERCANVAAVIPESKFDLDHEPARTEQQIRNGIARTIREGK